jgi:hypothetical protein
MVLKSEILWRTCFRLLFATLIPVLFCGKSVVYAQESMLKSDKEALKGFIPFLENPDLISGATDL